MTDSQNRSTTEEDVIALREEARAALQEALHEVKRVIVGQDAMLERLLVSLLAGGHVLLEGVPGLGQDADRQDARRGARRQLPAGSSSRPTSSRPTSSARASTDPTRRRFDTELGPGVRQLPARRRDQPRAGEGAVGAARGDAGAAGHDRRHDLPGAAPVPRDGDAEPDRVRGHLPAARGADRPLPDEDPRRLPVAPARRRRSSAAASPSRPTVREVVSLEDLRRYAAAPRTRARRPRRDRLRGRARRRHAAIPRSHGLARPRGADRVRRQPARADRPRRGRRRCWRCCADAAT